MEKGRGDMTDTESENEEREGDEGLHSEEAGVGSAVAVAHVAAAAMMPKLAPFPPAGAAGGTKAVEKRAPKRCEHGRQKSQCKECKGEPTCSHCLRAYLPMVVPHSLLIPCARCAGSAICAHKRIKSQCKDCDGTGICEHKRRRSRCKDCGGSGVCVHGKQRTRCKDCGGPGICEHRKRKDQCKDCGGSGICVHQRRKNRCKDCGGSGICVHGKQKARCKDCGGSSICEHNRRKSQCKDCGGSDICVHKKRRVRCEDCAAVGFAPPALSSLGVRATGSGAGGEHVRATAFPIHAPPQRRQKAVLTVSASLVPRDAIADAASGTHRATAAAGGVPKSQLCFAAAAAPLLECAPELHNVESSVHPLLPASVMGHCSAEHQQMEHPIASGGTQALHARPSSGDPGTATEALINL